MKRLLGFFLLAGLSFAVVLSACGGGAKDNASTCKPSTTEQHNAVQKLFPAVVPSSGIRGVGVARTLMGGANQGTALSVDGTVTTLAGTAGSSGSTDGTGTAARFNYPYGITTDGTNLYVADSANNTIRKVAIATGVVTTLVGNVLFGTADGTGTAARFNLPNGITTDGTNLYVTDTSNHTIRKVVIATGVVTTLAGTAGSSGSTDAMGAAALFFNPKGITTDGTNLFVSDTSNNTIRKVVIATGVVTTLAGGAPLFGSTDGTGTAARFYYPKGITTDGTNLYVADQNNNTIRKVVIATGVVTTLAGSAGMSGSTDGTGTAARFYYPNGITMDGPNLYVTDGWNHTIRKVVIATGVVTTLAGNAFISGSTDGTGTAARFNNPNGITTDGTNLYVADTDNQTIRIIGSAAGTGSGTGTAPGVPTGLIYTSATYKLSWTSVTGATSYTVNCVDTTSGASLAAITATTNYYDGFSTASTVTYSCTVTSVNAYGTSSASSSTTVGITAASTTTTTTSACTNPTTPSTATYYYANWSCGSSTQCASVMGGSSGSAGPICSSADCDAWGAKYIPAGYSCSTTATYTVTAQASSAVNGVCFKNGVDF